MKMINGAEIITSLDAIPKLHAATAAIHQIVENIFPVAEDDLITQYIVSR